MKNFLINLITFSPFLILGVIIFLIFFLILIKRRFFMCFCMTMFGLILVFISFINQFYFIPLDIKNLIYIDMYSILYALFILVSSLLILVYSLFFLKNYSGDREEFFIFLNSSIIGCLLLIIGNHFLTFFISSELISISLFGMMSYVFTKKRIFLKSMLQYVLLSIFSSSFLLLGFSLFYLNFKTLYFNECLTYLLSNKKMIFDPIFLISLSMIIVGIGFKLSFFPFNSWIIDVYHGMSIPVICFFNTITKISYTLFFVRFLKIFSNIEFYGLNRFLYIVSVLSILFGSITILFEKNILRFLAFLSISNIGYILSSLINLSSSDFLNYYINTEIYLFSHLISILSFFSIIIFFFISSNFSKKSAKYFIKEFSGLFWTHPFLAVYLTFTKLSIFGFPLTIGFIGKFSLIFLAIRKKLWVLLASIIFSGLINLYYCINFIGILYSRNQTKKYLRSFSLKEYFYSIQNNIVKNNYDFLVNFILLFFMFFLCFFIIFFGLFPKFLFNFMFYILN